ncbi:hypothetical protein [Bdellovibrio sp. BCCA]|uniref:hypothetical protein n=1 Tax=Bdellovibrio sp. BCCA TaxID=3136281 RepID=UPI0030F124E4
MSEAKKTSSSLLWVVLILITIGGLVGGSLHFEGRITELFSTSMFKLESVKKGDVISITGVCEIMGDIRHPPFLTTNVKVTNIDLMKKTVSGVVEDTLEPIDCNLEVVNVEAGKVLPPNYEKIKIGERIKKNVPVEVRVDVYEHIGRDVIVNGICKGRNDKEDTLVDAKSVVVGATKIGEVWELKIVSKTRKDNFTCRTDSAAIQPIVTDEQKQAKEEVVDYINKYLIVTGDCPVVTAQFRNLKSNEKVVTDDSVSTETIAALTTSKIQVRSQVIKEGKLARFTGLWRERKDGKGDPLIVDCDLEKDPSIRVVLDKK